MAWLGLFPGSQPPNPAGLPCLLAGGQRTSLNWFLSQHLGKDGFPTKHLVGELKDSVWLCAAEEGDGAPIPRLNQMDELSQDGELRVNYKLQTL